MVEDRYTPWDPEHLEILKKSVSLWNSWRSENLVSIPQLSGADLRGAEINGADLRNADLRDAKLRRAGLRKAELRRADLRKANLSGADLSGAKLSGSELNMSGANLNGADLRRVDLRRAELRAAGLRKANLRAADLRDADFRNTDLRGADLRDADFRNTDLGDAWVGDTTFGSSNLSEADGLDQLRHYGPSYLSLATLDSCGPELPDVFLKGIGYKDWEILAIKLRDPNLRPDQVIDITYKIADMRTNSPIQTNSIFFSYSSKDTPFVEAIEKRFNEDHINSWRDVHEISAGPIEAQLERAINLNGTVLLVLSKNSVNSEWVKYEVRKARKLQAKLEEENEKQMHVLCPVALDDSWKNCAWPPRIREDLEDYHILDCSDWQEPSFDVKYEKLKTNLGIYYFGQDRK